MSVDRVLRELIYAEDGDIIVTNQGALAAYVEAEDRWDDISGLDEVTVENGYRIFLNGPDDTIRITGSNATYGVIPLAAGYNLIGYPLQDTQSINTVLAPPINFVGGTDGDFIFTIAQDPSKPGLSGNMFAEFISGAWNFITGSGMEVLRPLFGYQVFVDSDAVISYPGATSSFTNREDGLGAAYEQFEQTRLAAANVDPDDPTTWAVDPAEYPMNMIITAQLEIDGALSADTSDLVAAFIDGECRGLGRLGYVEGLEAHYVVLFVYGEAFGKEVDIRFYDASSERVLFNKEKMKFVPAQVMGKFSDPYRFENKQFEVSSQAMHNACEEDTFGQLSIEGVNGMSEPLSYEWSSGDTTAKVRNLASGRYTVKITDAEGYWTVDTLEVKNENLEIPTPAVALLNQEVVCIRDEVKLQAGVENRADAFNYKWYNGRGKLLEEGPVYTIAAAEKDEDIYVESVLRACPSDRTHYTLKVNAPYAVYQVDKPSEQLLTGDTLSFDLSIIDEEYEYLWDFGDGQSSREAEPRHAYDKAGTYFVKLRVQDQAGCMEEIPSVEPVEVQTLTDLEEASLASFQAGVSPNPFVSRLNLNLQIDQPGKYELRLRDAQGRLLWRQRMNLATGPHDLTLPADEWRLADGVYYLEVEGQKGQIRLLKLLKAKP